MSLTGIAVSLLAQSTPRAGAPPEASTSLWELVVKGGPMMVPIALASLVALAVVAERMAMLRRKHVIPAGFLDGLGRALESSGGDAKAGLDYCRGKPSPISRICAAGLARAGRPLELIEKRITEQGEQEILHLRKRLRVLSVIASVTPLLGLTGTIFGMIEAFQTVAFQGEALGRTEQLAGGIYEAMVTTAAGLLVAIPALIFYHMLASRIERLVAEMDRASISFVEEWLEGTAADRSAASQQAGNGSAAGLEPTGRLVPLGAEG